MIAGGLDLSTGQFRGVAVDADGAVVERVQRSAASDDLVPPARELWQALKSAGVDGQEPVVAWDLQRGTLPPALAGALAREGGRPAVTIDVGHARVLAETWCGATRGCTDAVVLHVDEHVSAGVLAGGRLFTGAHGRAGAVAWLTPNPVEREDYRRYGGLEAEIALGGLLRRFVARIKTGDHSAVLDRVGNDLSRATVEHIFDAARDGDGIAISILRDTARYLGAAVANLATLLDPQCVVLSGFPVAARDLLFEPVSNECRRHIGPFHREHLQIVLAALGDDAPAIGAARAALLNRS